MNWWKHLGWQGTNLLNQKCEMSKFAWLGHNPNGRQYNLPTSSKVVAVIVGDFNVESSNHDIIIENKSSGLQRISELHPSFMSLQYLLLFPYGEDGFMKNISYRSNGEGKVRKRGAVTMREYYAFRLQQRAN